MPQEYQVNEIFNSVQGEGIQVGRPATFIRLQGCPVGCEWCDTKYTWYAGGEKMHIGRIMLKIARPWVVITGGEPTLWDLDALIEVIKESEPPGMDEMSAPMVQLETSGLHALKGRLVPDWVTISPKAMLDFKVPDELLCYADELKFVVDEDLTEATVSALEARRWEIRKLKPQGYPVPGSHYRMVVLMPEGSPPRPEMVEKALEWASRHPYWRVMDRMQYRFGVR